MSLLHILLSLVAVVVLVVECYSICDIVLVLVVTLAGRNQLLLIQYECAAVDIDVAVLLLADDAVLLYNDSDIDDREMVAVVIALPLNMMAD